jgi:hypothetical protein
MDDFEKLGVFYLGRPYDLVKKQAKEGLLLYDAKNLVTHAVCVGMTGSGKTGLCLALLEEAAIDGIPSLIIDPKGDLANLMLTFPSLQGEDFAPWINEDDARKKGLSSADFATQQAELWKNGLASWGQDGERIARLKEAAECVVYTPGSQAGIPVSILKSFAAPSDALREDPEALRERVSTMATSVLGLLGIEADPIKSREHILLAIILDTVWRQGKDLDLAGLIQQIQTPPVAKVGVLDLESFYPSKERFGLALQLNNLLASPGFSVWLEGEALDINRILYTETGKPRLAIVSIAHLSDAERMFFVTLLLSQMLSWVRTQSGTTSLRAILYMDEIFGYFPPVANPPSKGPLLTLLKQARAFGVGVVLATQNPVDLDYKGLANTGTWFIGRLQTERDKARVLEGLEGASASTGKKFDRQAMEQTLAGLGNRVFLMHNVHDEVPEVFETRWALSYLRGPLTRTQIKRLMDPVKAAQGEGGKGTASKGTVATTSAPQPSALTPHQQRPILPPDVPQYFVPIRGAQPRGSVLVYQPQLVGAAHVRFADVKKGVDVTDDVLVLAPLSDGPVAVDWDRAVNGDCALTDLERQPTEGAGFLDLPPGAAKAKSYDTWSKDFAGWLFRTQTLTLYKSPRFALTSLPAETERDFRVRLQQAAREARDQQAEKLRQKYAPKLAALGERKRRAEQAKEREAAQAKQSQIQAAISVGATILGAFLGRKAVSASTIGKATTAVRGAGRAIQASNEVSAAEENVAAIDRQLAALEGQFSEETESMLSVFDPLLEALDTVALKPTKSNITVRLVALAWVPYWQEGQGRLVSAWQ